MEIRILIDLSPATQAFLTALLGSFASGSVASGSTAAPATEGKTTRKPKGNTVALNPSAEGADTTDSSESSAEDTKTLTTEKVITLDDLKSLFATIKAAGKNDEVKAILASIYKKGLADLEPARYLWVYNEAKKIKI